MAVDSATIDPLARRIGYFRKALARGRLGHKASPLQSVALDRASRLSALAEQVLADPNATINDKIRADGAAHRARAALDAVLTAKPAAIAPLRERLLAEAEAQ